MGLSYEQEPVLDKLRKYYGDRLTVKRIMAGLVRDVRDFMNEEERSLPEEEGIRMYNRRLADIYRSEEPLGGMPIRMDGFQLFDKDHRSSYPLCIAYEAAKLTVPQKAEMYLYTLRTAAIVETRQTTKKEELIRCAQQAGIHVPAFEQCLHSGRAEQAFRKDLAYTRSLGIYTLPSYLLKAENQAVLLRGLLDFDTFVSAAARLSLNRQTV